MSRYVIWTVDENLEVFVGFDEGMEGFFLTIADARTCTGEGGSYLFHNLDHHHTPQMNLDEVEAVLVRFGLFLPPDLAAQLATEGQVVMRVAESQNLSTALSTRVLGWQSAA